MFSALSYPATPTQGREGAPWKCKVPTTETLETMGSWGCRREPQTQQRPFEPGPP